MSAAPFALSVQDLTMTAFREGRVLRALTGLSLDVRQGEILAVVDEAEISAQMLAAALLGAIIPPDKRVSGGIQLAGRRIHGAPERVLKALRGRVISRAFIDAEHALPPRIRVRRQIQSAFGAWRPRHWRNLRARVDQALEEVGLTPNEALFNAYPHDLSQEAKRRLGLMLALTQDPKILIIDDAAKGLEISERKRVNALLRRVIEARNLCALILTRRMTGAAALADRIALLYAGRLMEIGPARQVAEAPQHPYAAALRASAVTTLDAARGLAPMAGPPPDLNAPPPGCPLHPRCSRAFGPCERHTPVLSAVEGSMAACWLHMPVDLANPAAWPKL